MDDFTLNGDSFEEGLENLEKLLKICNQTHVSLSTIKFHMMMKEGIVLGHLLLVVGIQVDPANVEVIFNFPTHKTLTQVHIFISYAGYYRRFIEEKKIKNSKIAFPLFQLLPKDAEFVWTDECEIAFVKIK